MHDINKPITPGDFNPDKINILMKSFDKRFIIKKREAALKKLKKEKI